MISLQQPYEAEQQTTTTYEVCGVRGFISIQPKAQQFGCTWW